MILSAGCQKNAIDFIAPINGQLQIEITDAPIDNAEVRNAYVTFSGFVFNDTNLMAEKTTVDLLAYQKGNTKDMGVFNLTAQKYDRFSIILDLQEDAFGNVPGCYVSTQNGKKHNLYPSNAISKTLNLNLDNLEILPNQKTQIVIDFDLRKLIRYGKDDSEIKYQFVADHDMKDGIRVVCKDKTGSIRGRFTNNTGHEQQVIALIYRSGSFALSRELNNSETEIPNFFSAISSGKVNENGEFYLPFLNKSSYHLVFAAFHPTGSRDFIGILDAKAKTGTDLENIQVEPGNELIIQGSYSMILPN